MMNRIRAVGRSSAGNGDFKKNDILDNSLIRIVLNVGAPLLAVQLISILAVSYTNEVYSRHFGKLVFLITGVVSAAISLFQSAYGSVSSATWIRSAGAYAQGERKGVNKAAVNSLYSVTLMVFLCILILLFGKGAIFRMMNIPQEIHVEAGMYYYAQMLLMPLSGISTMLNTIITARGNRYMVFAENLMMTCGQVLAAVVFIVILKLGLWGWLLGSIPVTMLHVAIQFGFLHRCGFFIGLEKDDFKPDWKSIYGNVKYGCLMYLQMILCCISEMAIATQSNRYLDMDAIATVTVLLPVTSPLGICAILCSVFVPQNYGAGKTQRVRRFESGSIGFAAVYGTGCALFHILAGKWYFSRLFDDPVMVGLGREYWFWYGLSCIPLAMIYAIRIFFDSVGMAKVSMLSGVGELAGRLICAFWLIPCFGYVGRFMAPLFGWGLGGALMVVMYLGLRNKIYRRCDENAVGQAQKARESGVVPV